MQIKRPAGIVLILLLGISLISCGYSDYLFLDYDLHHGACWNAEHDRIAFIASVRAYRKPWGLSRFPDGGIPEYLLEDVSLYLFEPGDSSLEKIIDFNDLSEIAGTYRSSWKTRLSFFNGNIYFHVNPIMDWNWHKNQADRPEKVDKIKKLEEKYEAFYVYDLEPGKLSRVGKEEFFEIYNRREDSGRVSLTELNKMLLEVPLEELGLVVQDIYPKSERSYINEVIYGENTSRLTRRAVVEQFITGLPDKDIKNLLEKMESYKEQLEGYERQKYESKTAELREKLKSFLAAGNRPANS